MYSTIIMERLKETMSGTSMRSLVCMKKTFPQQFALDKFSRTTSFRSFC